MKDQDLITKEFLAVYDNIAANLFRHCFYKVSNREKALDLVQEAFTKTWEYLASGREVTHLKAFIYRTVNNLIIDEYRKKKTDSLDNLLESGFDPTDDDSSERISLSAEARLAGSGIKKLPQLYREVMELRFVDGLSISEIAEVVGESENNVSVRLARGMEKLKQALHTKEA